METTENINNKKEAIQLKFTQLNELINDIYHCANQLAAAAQKAGNKGLKIQEEIEKTYLNMNE
jgi:hypothetical protein